MTTIKYASISHPYFKYINRYLIDLMKESSLIGIPTLQSSDWCHKKLNDLGIKQLDNTTWQITEETLTMLILKYSIIND